MRDAIQFVKFSDINLEDTFFDSLKADYSKFVQWFQGKADAGASAFVSYRENSTLQGFLYLKKEEGEMSDVTPCLPAKNRLKIGTFKVDSHNTRMGERFFKKALEFAIEHDYDEVYATAYPKHEKLVQNFLSFGFNVVAKKGDECVLAKDLRAFVGDPNLDYPRITKRGNDKYLLSIYPKWHTEIFPDSALFSERYNAIKDYSPTNSIHKIYVTFMPDTARLKKGDLLVIYRTSDGLGSAWYRSVVTSVCVVEEARTSSHFVSEDEFLSFAKDYSVFSDADLRLWYRNPKTVIIKMTYNVALTRRLTRATLIQEVGLDQNAYFGFMKLTDNQFAQIIEKGEVNESYFVD